MVVIYYISLHKDKKDFEINLRDFSWDIKKIPFKFNWHAKLIKKFWFYKDVRPIFTYNSIYTRKVNWDKS